MNMPILTERTHLFSPSIKIAVIVDISGNISFTELDTAIAQAVASNEILCSTIKLDPKGAAFYHPVGKPMYTLHQSDEPWELLVSRQGSLPCNLEEGPLLDCFLLQREPVLRLLIIAHHLAGDGLSIVYLVQDIMQALAGNPLVFKPLAVLAPSSVGDARDLTPPMHTLLERQNRSWRKTGKVFSSSDYQRMVHSYWKNRNSVISHQNISKEILTTLARYAKGRGITLNTIIATAMIKVREEKTKLGLAVSVRPTGYQGMGNYASGISIHYRYNDKKTFTENAIAIHKLIQRKTRNDNTKFFLLRFLQGIDPTLIDAAYFSAYDGYDNPHARRMKRMFGYQGDPKQIGLSNLGILPIQEHYGAYRLQRFIFVPPLVPNNDFIMGIATFGSSLEISLVGTQKERPDEQNNILTQMVQELRTLKE